MVPETFKEFLSESKNPSKKQREFIDLVKHQIDLDLTPYVQEMSLGKRKFLTIETDDLEDRLVVQVERIALKKGHRFEPGGAGTKSIVFQ